MSSFFQSIKNYVRFSDSDTELLRAFLPHARPHFQRFAANFYDRIEQHPDASRVFEGPAQVARLKMTMMKWMRSGLKGPHDQDFYDRRSRIGRIHVIIGLPQHYMFTAMNVLRVDFQTVIAEVYKDDADRARATANALDKLLDLELAIMLRTYQEDSEKHVRANVRMAAVGRLATQVTVELRQPLDAIRSALYDLESVSQDDDIAVERRAVALRRAREQVDACEEIIGELVNLGDKAEIHRQRVDVLSLLGRAQASVALPESTPVELSCDAGLTVQADPHLLQYGVGELMACMVSAHRGRPSHLRVSAHVQDDDSVAIDVRSQGPDVRARLSGLGFLYSPNDHPARFKLERAMVENIAMRHGGVLEVLAPSEPGDGDSEITIRLLLPASGAGAALAAGT